MTPPLNLNEGQIIVVFDGYCVLCNHFVKWLAKRDVHHQLYFTTFNSDFLKQHYPKIMMEDTVITLNSDGKAFKKSKAVMECLLAIDYNPMIIKCFRIVPSSVADSIYTGIALTRYQLFGKKQHCTVPSGVIADRVLK